MPIEALMYFALGVLTASLLALLIMPAIWGRAVRLTKKRIEAATPMSLAEFRADKDQLRAEFALSTRRLEMNVEALRARLAEQVGDVNKKRTDLAVLKAERDQQLATMRELEEREGELRRRVLELEKEGAELGQRLRSRDRDYAATVSELETVRDEARARVPKRTDLEGKALTGDYARDVDQLLAALAAERGRTTYLEHQTRSLINRLESTDRRTTESTAAVAQLREALARKDDDKTDSGTALLAAEAKLASAESRLNALLQETQQLVTGEDARVSQLLADKLSLEDQVSSLREKVRFVETTILADWESERLSQGHMRERLNDIASDVRRLVYAVDGDPRSDGGESLFERVQRFADEPLSNEEMPKIPGRPRLRPVGGSAPNVVSDRLAALRDLPGRN